MFKTICTWFGPKDDPPRKTHGNVLLNVNDFLYDEIRKSAFKEIDSNLDNEPKQDLCSPLKPGF